MAALAVSVLALAPAPAEAQGSVAKDRAVLVNLYDSTKGDNWSGCRTNWKFNKPLGEWACVSTDAAGRVQRMEVEIKGTSSSGGQLLPELGDLTELRHLTLPGHRLTGTLPQELGRLSSLRHLALAENSLSDPIPTELDGLAELDSLHLGPGNSALTGCVPYLLRNVPSRDRNFAGQPLCPPPAPTLVLSSSGIEESGGSATGMTTVTVNDASSADVTVTVSAAPVPPAVAGDFTLSANKVLTIAAGSTTSRG